MIYFNLFILLISAFQAISSEKKLGSCNLKIVGNTIPDCPSNQVNCLYGDFKSKKEPELKLEFDVDGNKYYHLNLVKLNLSRSKVNETFDVIYLENPNSSEVKEEQITTNIKKTKYNKLKYISRAQLSKQQNTIGFGLENHPSQYNIIFLLPQDNDIEKSIPFDTNKSIQIKCKNFI